MTTRCLRAGCEREGRFQPFLTFTAMGQPRVPGQIAKVSYPFLCCTAHRNSLKIDDFLDDNAWEHLRAALAAQGRAEPDWASVRLEWVEPGTPTGH